MNTLFMKELLDCVHEADEKSVRAIVITGRGRFFSAGGDVAEFGEDLERLPRLLYELTSNLHTAISRLARMNAPVIAAVNGPCAGAGLSLACACDLVLAAQSASFTTAYTGVGLTSDGGASWFLPRRIGDLRARELMITNRRLPADEARDWGLVNEVVPDESLLARALEVAARLASGPTVAYGKIKALLDDSFANGMETQMALESRSMSEAAKTEDAKESIRAFLSKRIPSFKGV
jgi:2-(1,2-epoxy-1,2-dihydrophenyl)acetyl-CoA isomerase